MFQVRYERKGLSLQSAFIVILLSAFYAKKDIGSGSLFSGAYSHLIWLPEAPVGLFKV